MDSAADPATTTVNIAASSLDLSSLVGHQIKIYTAQMPGKMIQTRVVSVHNQQISIDSHGNANLIDNLVSQQKVVVQFGYKGQEISIRAKLTRSMVGRCHLTLEDQAVPLSQRRFHRLDLLKQVRLAAFPLTSSNRRNLSGLRWIETESVNLSSGGILVTIPSYLQSGIHLLMNVVMEEYDFPVLVLGQVRHCFQASDGQFRIGVEFMIKETAQKLFSQVQMQSLPISLFQYSRLSRDKLNQDLMNLA